MSGLTENRAKDIKRPVTNGRPQKGVPFNVGEG